MIGATRVAYRRRRVAKLRMYVMANFAHELSSNRQRYIVPCSRVITMTDLLAVVVRHCLIAGSACIYPGPP